MPYAPKYNVVSRRVRPNYAAILSTFIASMAEAFGMTEEQYRGWIRTEDGARVFEVCAWHYGVPVFRCHKGKR